AFVGQLDGNKKSIHVLSGCSKEGDFKLFDYDLKDSPCQSTIIRQYALYPINVQQSFPKDKLLKKMKIQAYGAISLFNKSQEAIGVFVILSKTPFQNTHLVEHILKLYVSSLSAEMERCDSELNTTNLENIAYYDPLTKLPNRLLITDRIHQAIKNQSRTGKIVAICLMDLDGFKAVNDTLGHDAGDYVLIESSRRIEKIIRPEDTIARLGGDEFVILINEMSDSKDVGKILLRILKNVSKPYHYQNSIIHSISASIGVTLYPEDQVDDDTLIRHADQAMYKAKENGKNQFYFFDTKEHQKVQANFKALTKIKKALDSAQFELYFQPKLSAHTLKIESVEVLTRWNHPILGVLSPNEFLPLIENDDIVYAFDEWVIRETILALLKLQKQNISLLFSINISPKQFKDRRFVHKVKRIADKLDIDYTYFQNIEFEIVESSALESLNYTNDTIHELKKVGIHFALDDFGTGYSSLTHLRELHINTIKIDQSFIAQMLKNSQDMAIVNAIISLSKVFQIEVVAEGVEHIDQLLMLFELGCDYIQGYAIAKPMSFDTFINYLQHFSPDPRWNISLNHIPKRAEFELLVAQSNHKYWIELVIESLTREDIDSLPQLSHLSCRLGKWLNSKGKKNFASLPSFFRLSTLHEKIHQEVTDLVEIYKTNPKAITQEKIHSIIAQRDEVILIIEHLKEEYRMTNMIKGVKYER
ncbi:MAG: EAL domain-containing protein, partial [Campylobacterales bacterium]|nr:EAL domain-containing protein [Campylobacterales bacterium]